MLFVMNLSLGNSASLIFTAAKLFHRVIREGTEHKRRIHNGAMAIDMKLRPSCSDAALHMSRIECKSFVLPRLHSIRLM